MLVLLAPVVGKRPSTLFELCWWSFCFIRSTLLDFIALRVTVDAN